MCLSYYFQTVGLRFANVYGPWSPSYLRVFQLASAIATSVQVDVYQQNGQVWQEDYVYVKDVADMVLKSLDYVSAQCYDTLILSSGHSVPTTTVIRYIQITTKFTQTTVLV